MPSRRTILILLLSRELVGMVEQKFHKNRGVRRLLVIPGDCSDNPKPELPVEGDHSGVAFPAVGNNAIKSMIAGEGDLPGFEERAEALLLESREDAGGADVEGTLAFFEGAATDLGFADDQPVGFAGLPIGAVEAVRFGKYFAVEGEEAVQFARQNRCSEFGFH